MEKIVFYFKLYNLLGGVMISFILNEFQNLLKLIKLVDLNGIDLWYILFCLIVFQK